MYKCKKCGSTDIKIKDWYNPNIDKVNVKHLDEVSGGTDVWCDNCQEHTGIKWVEDAGNINLITQIEELTEIMKSKKKRE